MTVRAGVVGWLILSCGVACGGATQAPDGDVTVPIAGATASGSGSGGNAMSVGGNAMSVGGNDPGEEPMCEGSGPSCVLSCRSFQGATDSVCVGHRFVCPEPRVAFDSCPDDACIRSTRNCCSPTGQRTVPDCAADGTIGRCPDGYEVRTGDCLPRGVEAQSCAELQTGDACTSAELVCDTGRCGRNCFCMADESSNLKWNCFALPC
jgi:hypothetical protein